MQIKRAYKLFRVRKDGSIGSLFINAQQRYELNRWMIALPFRRSGFRFRPGWHALEKPKAPHLSLKGRQWFLVELKDFNSEVRPESQGGKWYLSKYLRIVRPLTKAEQRFTQNYE
jgi:hypothetical protein